MAITKTGPLPSLTDVDDALAPAAGDVLVYDGAQWVAAAASGGNDPLGLADLIDVDDALAPALNQVLTYDGAEWGAAPPALANLTLEQLTNVEDAPPASTGELLRWSGSQWDNASAASAVALANLENLQNVVDGAAVADELLAYNGTNWDGITPAALGAKISLEQLSNVADPAPTAGEVLTFTGSAWDGAQPATPRTTLESLTNVEDTAPTASGDLLQWNGTAWDNGAILAPAAGYAIQHDGPALRVRNAAGTIEGVVVDTASQTLQGRNALDVVLFRDNAAAIPVWRVDGQNGQLLGGGSTPTIAIGAALGSGATASVLWGNDTWMYLILNPGTSGMAIGTAATVTLSAARPNGNFGVWLNPISTKAMDTGGAYATAATGGSFTVTFRVAPSASGTMHYLAYLGGMGA
jgi:hypothetical protein